MDPINRYSLEDFAERHRADFDLHEPRPELWDVLEKQLDADAATRPGHAHMSVATEQPVAEAPAPQLQPAATVAAPLMRVQRRPLRWQPVGIVMGMLALVLTLGLSRWNASPAAADVTTTLGATAQPADAALYQPEAMLASTGGPGSNGNARLDTAVHGMERYYAVQLAERQAQLTQLAPDNQAEWAHDLASLDSIYRQLKHELPLHPQPEVVLTAMNRNLQTRLDILDQQLSLRGDAQVAQRSAVPGGEYTLADSRVVADNLLRRHER